MPNARMATSNWFRFGSEWNLRCSLARRSALRLARADWSFQGEIGRILGWGTNIHTKVRSAVVFFHGENRVDGQVELVGGCGNALFFF
jgi:hypothetical protein